MSRISDLLDLLQNTNDFYLVNPARNIRSVYIQIDDLCELAMKSWLQSDTGKRQARFIAALQMAGLVGTNHHRAQLRRFFAGNIDENGLETGLGATTGRSQANLRGCISAHAPLLDWSAHVGAVFKDFQDVVGEVKTQMPINGDENTVLHRILDSFVERRANRNRFFHDQNQSGLTVDNDSCLQAFIDLYWLCAFLFGEEYLDQLRAKAVVRAQIAIIKLKHYGTQAGAALNHYQQVLTAHGSIEVRNNTVGHEFCALHEDALNFLQKLQRHFETQVLQRQDRMRYIEGLRKKTRNHQEQLTDLSDQIVVLQDILRKCFESAV